MPTTTRGPLPSGVYWRRRAAVLTLAVVLVLLFAKLLGSGGGGGDGQARQVGAPTSPTATVTVGKSTSPTATANTKKGKGKKGRHKAATALPTDTPTPTPTPTTPPPLPDPSGPCGDDDVFMTPSVDSAVAGSDVTFLMNFQTASSDACTFDLSSDSVRVKIAHGKDTVWESNECPKAIPTQQIVVRKTTVTQVPVTWKDAKRSDEECSGNTAWALPNTYSISGSVLGGEPTVVDFDLVAPTPVTVTETVHPTVGATASATNGTATSAPPAG